MITFVKKKAGQYDCYCDKYFIGRITKLHWRDWVFRDVRLKDTHCANYTFAKQYVENFGKRIKQEFYYDVLGVDNMFIIKRNKSEFIGVCRTKEKAKEIVKDKLAFDIDFWGYTPYYEIIDEEKYKDNIYIYDESEIR